MHETPTPKTDAAEFPVMTFPSRDNPLVVRSIIVRNLERRLTIARKALERVTLWSTENSVLAVAKQALTQTAPKP